jgi:hypothetical protein
MNALDDRYFTTDEPPSVTPSAPRSEEDHSMIGQFFVSYLFVIFLSAAVMEGTNTPYILTSVFLTALVLVSFAIYFMPTIIAYVRDHHSVLAIFVANFFLGWTFLGWVGALVWSVMPVGSRTATA